MIHRLDLAGDRAGDEAPLFLAHTKFPPLFGGEFPSGRKSVESSGSKSLVFFGQFAYILYLRF
jgi:hypothetical protein